MLCKIADPFREAAGVSQSCRSQVVTGRLPLAGTMRRGIHMDEGGARMQILLWARM